MGIIVLYNRVYECVSTMYTNYANNFDTSHVAYPEQVTAEDQVAAWAIFTAQQPPLTDPPNITNTRRPSSTAALHTYPVTYIPPYIFPTSTTSHPSAPTTSSPPILPTNIASPPPHASHKTQEAAADTNDMVQQMLHPLVNNSDAAPLPATLV